MGSRNMESDFRTLYNLIITFFSVINFFQKKDILTPPELSRAATTQEGGY